MAFADCTGSTCFVHRVRPPRIIMRATPRELGVVPGPSVPSTQRACTPGLFGRSIAKHPRPSTSVAAAA